jgi:hypothetical protein
MVQIWLGLFECKQAAISLGHIWTTLYIYITSNTKALVSLQYKLIGFYNPDEKCLQRGTDWVFK